MTKLICMKRRGLLLMMAAGVAPVISGCLPLTEKLLKNSPRTITYTETISVFLITPDGKNLVVLGDDYHYIFNAPLSLIQSLQESIHTLLSANLSGFSLNGNQVSGRYELTLDPKASSEQKATARKVGFQLKPDGSVILEGTLSGTRYSAQGFNTAAVKNKFNKTYQVEVSELSTVSEGPGAKILLTPVTLAVDGVLVLIGTAVLIPLLFGICIGSKGTCSAGG